MAKTLYMPDLEQPATPFNSKKSGKALPEAMYSTIQGLSQKNARMWQIVALVSLSAFFIAIAVLCRAATLPKTVPVIVTVDTQGQASYVGRIDRKYWGSGRIPEEAKTYQIKRLFANMYTWSTDPRAERMYMQSAASICTGNAGRQLNEFFDADNPFNRMGRVTQEITMEEPLKQTERTYVIYYNTAKYEDARPREQRRMSALVTLDFYECDELNPLGIYITNFDIKEVKKGE